MRYRRIGDVKVSAIGLGAMSLSIAGRPDRGRADDVPVPADWGGYVVRPFEVEFWQGRPGRLHDRLVYTRADEGWTTQRLAP